MKLVEKKVKKKKKKRKHPPLTTEQLIHCPHGTNKCRICRLPPFELETIHNLRLEKGYSHRKLQKYMKENLGITPDGDEIKAHFNKHIDVTVSVVKPKQKGAKRKITAITKVLHPIKNHEIQIRTDADIENAYQSLVKMASQYTKNVYNLQSEIIGIIKKKDIPEELTGLSAIELLDRLAKLNREARSQVKDISNLRGPKVMIATVLETFINSAINEMSGILTNLCGELNFEIIKALKTHKMQAAIPTETFTSLFKNVALNYRTAMLNLKRQTLTNALAALSDMEKVI